MKVIAEHFGVDDHTAVKAVWCVGFKNKCDWFKNRCDWSVPCRNILISTGLPDHPFPALSPPVRTDACCRGDEDDSRRPPVKLQVARPWTPPLKGRWIVVWYRQVLPRRQGDDTLPLVNIALRNLDPRPGADWCEFSRIDRPVTELGCLRLGTILENGRVNERIELGSTRDFPVHFPDDGGPIMSSTELEDQTASLPSWFAGVSLEGRALVFPLPGSGSLWIQCMEFLSRFYGRSQEIKRVLLAYPWRWATECLIGAEPAALGSAPVPDEWRVRFGWGERRLVPADAVFLAHLRYSPLTQRLARGLDEQTDVAHPRIVSAPRDGVYLEVEPWFSGPAILRVSGFPLPDGGFLALRLDGGTDPEGPRVVQERDRPARDRPGRPGGADAASSRRWSRLVALDRDRSPDRGSFHVPLPDQPFDVLGVPQSVDEVLSESSGAGLGESAPRGDAEAVASTAEPSGSARGVESAVVGAPLRSLLRDVWDVLRDLRRRYPKRILSLYWYHPSRGFVFSRSPQLVSLAPPPSAPGTGGTRVDCGPRGGVGFRALLVVRVVVADDPASSDIRALYIVEIERRLTPDGDAEKFPGWIFEIAPNDDPATRLDAWLTKLRADLVRSDGVLHRELRLACPGRAAPFSHSPARSGPSAESAVRNAFRKMGVVLPE